MFPTFICFTLYLPEVHTDENGKLIGDKPGVNPGFFLLDGAFCMN
jgi:hypothetical protein